MHLDVVLLRYTLNVCWLHSLLNTAQHQGYPAPPSDQHAQDRPASWGPFCSPAVSAATFYPELPTFASACRTYTIAFGASLLPFGFIPSFRKMRVILVIGVFGTLFTGTYGIWVAAHKGFDDAPSTRLWPDNSGFSSFQTFFNGMAILFAILDHHVSAGQFGEVLLVNDLLEFLLGLIKICPS